MKIIDLDYLNECLDYNPEKGLLIWRHRPERHFKDGKTFKSCNKRHGNKTAGGLSKNGYIYIEINSESYLAHRLAWALYYDYFPENEIDHKDRIRHHNWIDNLREASHVCNIRNKGIMSNNKSGVTGVSFNKKNKKWIGTIAITGNGKNIYLGSFKLFDDAVKARWEAEKKYKFPNCCTSSSSYSYLKNKNLI